MKNRSALSGGVDRNSAKKALISALAEKGILAGLPVEEGILWCATEMNAKEDIDELIAAIGEVLA